MPQEMLPTTVTPSLRPTESASPTASLAPSPAPADGLSSSADDLTSSACWPSVFKPVVWTVLGALAATWALVE